MLHLEVASSAHELQPLALRELRVPADPGTILSPSGYRRLMARQWAALLVEVHLGVAVLQLLAVLAMLASCPPCVFSSKRAS